MKPTLIGMLQSAWSDQRTALIAAILAEPDFDPNKAAVEAIRAGDSGLFEHLIANTSCSPATYINSVGSNMLMIAVDFEQHKFIPRLQELGLNIDAQDNFGNTALLLAKRRGVSPCERAVGKLGARDDIPNNQGITVASLKEPVTA